MTIHSDFSPVKLPSSFSARLTRLRYVQSISGCVLDQLRFSQPGERQGLPRIQEEEQP
jgi:hypothetical protein